MCRPRAGHVDSPPRRATPPEIVADPALPLVMVDPHNLSRVLLILCQNAGAMPCRSAAPSSSDSRASTPTPGASWIGRRRTGTIRGALGGPRYRVRHERRPARARTSSPFSRPKTSARARVSVLAVVRAVGQHQGGVEVETEVGRGSTFHLFLPTTAPTGFDLDRGTDSNFRTPAGSGFALGAQVLGFKGRSPFVCITAMKNLAAAGALLALVVATPGCYTTMDNRSRWACRSRRTKSPGNTNARSTRSRPRPARFSTDTYIISDLILLSRVLTGKIDSHMCGCASL